MKRLLPCLTLVIIAGTTSPVHAQWFDRLINPDVVVELNHPPSLGIKAKRVAFAPTTTPAADELVSACIADLSTGGQLEILDRGNIEKVLKEQKFSNSGLVDASSAVELGKLLGSPVLLFVKVFNMKTSFIPLSHRTEGWSDKKGNYHPAVTTYTSKTQVDFTASVQAVDLGTGKVYSQKRIAVAPALEASSDQGRPEYPSETEVRELAITQAKTEVHRMLLSWTEPRKLIFYDDKDYGMKDAYKRLQLKDYEGALAKSVEALSQAKADPKLKPKYLGRTNYNVGMCHFILGDYDASLPFLKAARETDPSHTIFAQSTVECEKAIKLRDDMNKVDAKSAKLEMDTPKQDDAPAPKAKAGGEAKAGAGEGGDIDQRLEKLEKLKKKGLITPQEYKKKKDEIMKDI
jgi:tetratricopeptide (TPR) repeat protein